MADPIALEDILPEKPEFTLAGQTYTLRAPTAHDRVWMKQFGDENSISAIFQNRSWDQIGKIVYRLLDQKECFQAVTMEEIDDNGESVKRRYTGPELLLMAIQTIDDERVILGALTKAFALSNPLIDKYIQEEILKKNRSEESPAGEKSLISSEASTDTPSTKSGE